MWKIEQGISIVRALQPHTRQFGYHLCLGGGVLNNGESQKDLDLYFLPMGGFNPAENKKDPDGMHAFLVKLWGDSIKISKSKSNYYTSIDSIYKYAVQFSRKGGTNRDIPQRIDCFIF